MKGRESLTLGSLAEAVQENTSYLQGKRDFQPSGMEMIAGTPVSGLLEAGSDAMKSVRGTSPDRFTAMYKFALARDAAYAMAGRRFVKALASHNYMRGIYESAKFAAILEA